MIVRPTLLLDSEKCRKNIEKMVLKARKNKLIFRPHFKTHQSVEIGNWFKEFGVAKITVSSLKMAEYFSNEWSDITVAFPVNILEIEIIQKLSAKISLNLLVESLESLDFLIRQCDKPIGVFLKIDVGYNRTGIEPENHELIESLLSKCKDSEKIKFRGFLGHAGHTYDRRNISEIVEIHNKSVQIMNILKNKFFHNFPDAIISLGDTPGCSVIDNFRDIDEIRPGNFVFYDLTQVKIGSNKLEEVAVALACPVVSIHENKLIIYGGAIHFSKEHLEDTEYGTIYGIVVDNEGLKWKNPIKGMYVSKLSQEHGTVHIPKDQISNHNIGDYLLILPVHSCLTANQMGSYLTADGKRIERFTYCEV